MHTQTLDRLWYIYIYLEFPSVACFIHFMSYTSFCRMCCIIFHQTLMFDAPNSMNFCLVLKMVFYTSKLSYSLSQCLEIYGSMLVGWFTIVNSLGNMLQSLDCMVISNLILFLWKHYLILHMYNNMNIQFKL
jgi:hypothetical protein